MANISMRARRDGIHNAQDPDQRQEAIDGYLDLAMRHLNDPKMTAHQFANDHMGREDAETFDASAVLALRAGDEKKAAKLYELMLDVATIETKRFGRDGQLAPLMVEKDIPAKLLNLGVQRNAPTVLLFVEAVARHQTTGDPSFVGTPAIRAIHQAIGMQAPAALAHHLAKLTSSQHDETREIATRLTRDMDVIAAARADNQSPEAIARMVLARDAKKKPGADGLITHFEDVKPGRPKQAAVVGVSFSTSDGAVFVDTAGRMLAPGFNAMVAIGSSDEAAWSKANPGAAMDLWAAKQKLARLDKSGP